MPVCLYVCMSAHLHSCKICEWKTYPRRLSKDFGHRCESAADSACATSRACASCSESREHEPSRGEAASWGRAALRLPLRDNISLSLCISLSLYIYIYIISMHTHIYMYNSLDISTYVCTCGYASARTCVRVRCASSIGSVGDKKCGPQLRQHCSFCVFHETFGSRLPKTCFYVSCVRAYLNPPFLEPEEPLPFDEPKNTSQGVVKERGAKTGASYWCAFTTDSMFVHFERAAASLAPLQLTLSGFVCHAHCLQLNKFDCYFIRIMFESFEADCMSDCCSDLRLPAASLCA